MNLRENKMDQFDTTPKRKGFFDFTQSTVQPKKLPQPQKTQQIAPTHEAQRISAPPQQPLLYSENTESLPVPQKEQWIRKEDDVHVQKDYLDFQRNHEHIEEHSRYIKQYPEDILVHWRGPEFEHYPRDKQWYMGAALILSAIVVYAIFTDGIIMAIVFILVGLTGYLMLSRPQKVVDFAITHDGVLVGDEIYEYENIKSFWIFYEPPHTRVISLHMKGHFRPYLHIPLHQIDPVIIHEKLTQFIPEKKQEQNLIDVLERLLRL